MAGVTKHTYTNSCKQELMDLVNYELLTVGQIPACVFLTLALKNRSANAPASNSKSAQIIVLSNNHIKNDGHVELPRHSSCETVKQGVNNK